MLETIKLIFLVILPLLVLLVAGFLGWRRNIIQSGIKLGTVILSIIISVVIIKTVLPNQVDSLLVLASDSGIVDSDLLSDFQSSEYLMDLFRLILAMVMPILYISVFFMMNSLFSLLYIIPGRIFSNKAIAKRAAKRAEKAAAVTVPDLQTSENSEITVSEQVTQEASIDTSAETSTVEPVSEQPPEKKINWMKVGLKAASVVCSMLAGFLVLSSFMLPVGYYSEFALDCTESINDEVFDDLFGNDAENVLDALREVDDHFTVNCYQLLNAPVSASLNTFTSHTGTKAVATDTFIDFFGIIGILNTDGITSEQFYAFADKLEENAFLNEMFTGFFQDLVKALDKGESLLGIDTSESDGPINLLKSLVSDDRLFSDTLRMMGDMITLSESMQSNDPDDLEDAITTIVDNMNSDSAEVYKDVMKVAFGDSVGDQEQAYADFTAAVLDSIVSIKDDDSLSADEKEDILEREKDSLIAVMDIATGEGEADLLKLVETCIDSAALTDAVMDATNDGSVSDPYGFADNFSNEMVNSISDKLENKGYKEGSATYNAYMALIQGAA